MATKQRLTTGLSRVTYQHLVLHGLSPAEAGNVAAYLAGLTPVAKGWTVREIEQLRFLRHLRDGGRLEPGVGPSVVPPGAP